MARVAWFVLHRRSPRERGAQVVALAAVLAVAAPRAAADPSQLAGCRRSPDVRCATRADDRVRVFLREPQALAYDAGSLVVADTGDARILAFGNADVTALAGSGLAGFSGDGGPARDAQLALPLAISPDGAGGLLIADSGNHRIRRVLPSGEIETVAGTGTSGFSGDGGPATAAELSFPGGVAALPDGGFVIGDTGNDRIREVSPSGAITTVPSGSTTAIAGGGTGTCTRLSSPSGLAVTAAGAVYVADTANNRVCLLEPDGQLTVVAGTGDPGYTGDSGDPLAATLNRPTGLALEARGQLLIADTGNQVVRRIGLDGRIRTVAGTGASGYSGDGGPATAAMLSAPAGVAVADDGTFVIADTGNDAVRRVAADGSIDTVLGASPGRTLRLAPAALGVRILDTFRSYITPKPVTGHAGKKVVITYYTSERAIIDVRILTGTRTMRHAHVTALPGARAILFRPLRPGRYGIRLVAHTASGSRTDQGGLRVLRRG